MHFHKIFILDMNSKEITSGSKGKKIPFHLILFVFIIN